MKINLSQAITKTYYTAIERLEKIVTSRLKSTNFSVPMSFSPFLHNRKSRETIKNVVSSCNSFPTCRIGEYLIQVRKK